MYDVNQILNDPRLIASKMTCPYDGASVVFVENDVVYAGRKFGSGFVYVCSNFPRCDSFVGCHGPKADERQRWKPLGTLANKELRQARKSVHHLIDPYWKNPNMLSRPAVYRILRRILDVPQEQAHIAMLDLDQCRKVLEQWESNLPEPLRNAFLIPRIFPNQTEE